MDNTVIADARADCSSLHRELVESRRTLILPCSEKKLQVPSAAFDLYQGSGYLSVVKKHDRRLLDRAFNIYFLSAKHGIIRASDWIEPYDLKLSDELVESFAANKHLLGKARRHIKEMNHNMTLYLMVPKMYQKAFMTLAGSAIDCFKDIVPATGGILSQRGQLKRLIIEEIEAADIRSRMDSAPLLTFSNGKPLEEVWNLLKVGDWVRPWMSGAGSTAEFAETTQVVQINCWPCGQVDVVDDLGRVWSSFQVATGIKHHGISSHRLASS